MDGDSVNANATVDLTFDPETSYKIEGGKVITYLDGVPFAIALYKMGTQHLAARDDEYANYEINSVQR